MAKHSSIIKQKALGNPPTEGYKPVSSSNSMDDVQFISDGRTGRNDSMAEPFAYAGRTRIASARFSFLVSVIMLGISVSTFCLIFVWMYGVPYQMNAQREQLNDLTALVIEQQQRIDEIQANIDPEKSADKICSLPVEVGPCEALAFRWHWDSKEAKCKEFNYGGCQGNANNFKTEAECMKKCDPQTPYTGPVEIISKVFEGDSNRQQGPDADEGPDTPIDHDEIIITDPVDPKFSRKTPEENGEGETDVCSLNPSAGPCSDQLPRYYFDVEQGECKKFLYGGCSGNDNNFVTRDLCEKTCKNEDDEDLNGKIARRFDVCKMDSDVGLCRASMERWFYDSVKGRCEIFYWGGCGGNDNNFSSKEKCEQTCIGELVDMIKKQGDRQMNEQEAPAAKDEDVTDEEEDPCTLKMQTGMCRGAFPRFYFNAESGECENFIYGGCDGNANNFHEKEDCEAACKKN